MKCYLVPLWEGRGKGLGLPLCQKKIRKMPQSKILFLLTCFKGMWSGNTRMSSALVVFSVELRQQRFSRVSGQDNCSFKLCFFCRFSMVCFHNNHCAIYSPFSLESLFQDFIIVDAASEVPCKWTNQVILLVVHWMVTNKASNRYIPFGETLSIEYIQALITLVIMRAIVKNTQLLEYSCCPGRKVWSGVIIRKLRDDVWMLYPVYNLWRSLKVKSHIITDVIFYHDRKAHNNLYKGISSELYAFKATKTPDIHPL